MTNSLAFPMLDMMLLTMVVWIYMFIQRVGYATANNLDIESMKSPQDIVGLIPPENSSASNNFKNLFELPVLFYVALLLALNFMLQDLVLVALAWMFVLSRVAHALIHISYNDVMHRFLVYVLGSLVVMGMWMRLGWYILSR